MFFVGWSSMHFGIYGRNAIGQHDPLRPCKVTFLITREDLTRCRLVTVDE
jgi:hypothetical protein